MVDDMSTVASVGWKDLTWRIAISAGCALLLVLEFWAVTGDFLHVDVHQADGPIINILKILPFFIPVIGMLVFLSMETEHHRKKYREELERRSEDGRVYLSDLRNRYPVDVEVKRHLIQLGYANVAAYIEELEYKLKAVPPK